jgi:hypothetical protein
MCIVLVEVFVIIIVVVEIVVVIVLIVLDVFFLNSDLLTLKLGLDPLNFVCHSSSIIFIGDLRNNLKLVEKVKGSQLNTS